MAGVYIGQEIFTGRRCVPGCEDTASFTISRIHAPWRGRCGRASRGSSKAREGGCLRPAGDLGEVSGPEGHVGARIRQPRRQTAVAPTCTRLRREGALNPGNCNQPGGYWRLKQGLAFPGIEARQVKKEPPAPFLLCSSSFHPASSEIPQITPYVEFGC